MWIHKKNSVTGLMIVIAYLNILMPIYALQWRHNNCVGISNRRRLDSLLNRLFRRRSKKTSMLRVTGLCEGNPTTTGRFPSQRASNVKNAIWWRHQIDHELLRFRFFYNTQKIRESLYTGKIKTTIQTLKYILDSYAGNRKNIKSDYTNISHKT